MNRRKRTIIVVALAGTIGAFATLSQMLRPRVSLNSGSGTSSVQVVVRDMPIFQQVGPDSNELERRAMWYVHALLATDLVLAIVYGLLLGWFVSRLWRTAPGDDAG